MKKYISILISSVILASCTITKNYYLTVTNPDDQEQIAEILHNFGGKDCDNIPAEYRENGNLMVTRYDGKEYANVKKIHYDAKAPTHIRIPELLETPGKYNPEDKYTFPIYGNVQTVNPCEDGIYSHAIWCTKDATYLATIYQQFWDLHYFQCPHDTYIRDVKTGKKYYILEELGLPMDKSFNIKGVAGSYICFVAKFPPLPKSCTIIDIVSGETNDDVKNGLGWSHEGPFINIPVALLQANQHIADYKEVKVIE